MDGPRPEMAMGFSEFWPLPLEAPGIQNIGYALRIQGKEKGEIDRLVSHYTELVGLGGFEANYPSQLSGGMQQRAGLARALAAQPDVLCSWMSPSALSMRLPAKPCRKSCCASTRAEPKAMSLHHPTASTRRCCWATGVLVMTPRPGRIRFQFETGFGRGRDLEEIRGGKRFQALRHYLWEAMRNPEGGTRTHPRIRPKIGGIHLWLPTPPAATGISTDEKAFWERIKEPAVYVRLISLVVVIGGWELMGADRQHRTRSLSATRAPYPSHSGT